MEAVEDREEAEVEVEFQHDELKLPPKWIRNSQPRQRGTWRRRPCVREDTLGSLDGDFDQTQSFMSRENTDTWGEQAELPCQGTEAARPRKPVHTALTPLPPP